MSFHLNKLSNKGPIYRREKIRSFGNHKDADTDCDQSNYVFASNGQGTVRRSGAPHTARNTLTINGRFLTQNPTGVQRYAREIVCALDVLLQDEQWRSSISANLIVPSAGAHALDLRAIHVQATMGRMGGPLWTQCVLPFLSRGVLLSLGNIGPILPSNHIVCIHDLNTYLAPESYSAKFRLYYKTLLPLLAKRAAQVVTVSNFSARMLDEFKLCPLSKVKVIPNGYEHVERWRPDRSAYAASLANCRPFVFVLGSRARHKNVQILFEIAQELDALGLDLLVAGAPGQYFSQVEQSSAPNVRMLGYVSDDDLAALYRSAFCFAFPSLTEGFGLPVLEAMALGCPVITSDCASMPEICGDAALYADPKSPRSWITQIKRLHADQDLAAGLREKGRCQATRYSWMKSAMLYLNLILSLFPGSGDDPFMKGRGVKNS